MIKRLVSRKEQVLVVSMLDENMHSLTAVHQSSQVFTPLQINSRYSMKASEGIRVLDFTHVYAGPFASYQLVVMDLSLMHVVYFMAKTLSGCLKMWVFRRNA